MKLYNEDCLKVLPNLKDKSIDLILADPPYSVTACKWDIPIPLDKLWIQLKRIIKDTGTIVLFGIEPFSTHLRLSNIDWYKYDWIWDKGNSGNPFLAKVQPLRIHELISVFYKKNTYYPQGVKPVNKLKNQGFKVSDVFGHTNRKQVYLQHGTNYPRSILRFKFDRSGLHATQKPVPLMEYLINTYTQKNETVLDFVMGSGTTGVACKNTDREFIGIELDKKYFEIAESRLNENYDPIYTKTAARVRT